MTSERRFFSGATLAQALNQAAQHFQVSPEQIRYKQIEKRHGFLRSRKKVMIEVDGVDAVAPEPAMSDAAAEETVETPGDAPRGEPGGEEEAAAEERAPESEAQPPEPGPSEGAMLFDEDREEKQPPKKKRGRRRKKASHVVLPESPVAASSRFPEAEGEEAEAAERALETILEVAGIELEYKILQGDEQLEIEVWGDDQDILLRDRGRLLLAIQHLLPRAIRGLIGRSVVCRVDSDSFHEIREERLRDLAQRAADQVRQGGRTKKLEPMSPDERRIVHLTLADYPGVETESQGTGLFKRVMVRPSGEGGPRSYSR